MSQSTAPNLPSNEETARPVREVRYEHSLNLAPLLEHLRVALLVSTYQAGKLVVVGAREGKSDATGVRARGKHEVVLQLLLVAVVNQVDPRVNVLVLDPAEGGDVGVPLPRVVAGEVVARAGKWV